MAQAYRLHVKETDGVYSLTFSNIAQDSSNMAERSDNPMGAYEEVRAALGKIGAVQTQQGESFGQPYSTLTIKPNMDRDEFFQKLEDKLGKPIVIGDFLGDRAKQGIQAEAREKSYDLYSQPRQAHWSKVDPMFSEEKFYAIYDQIEALTKDGSLSLADVAEIHKMHPDAPIYVESFSMKV